MGLGQSPPLPTRAAVICGALGLVLVALPAEAGHFGDCSSTQVDPGCSGNWRPTKVVNPAWWGTPGTLYSHGSSENNQPLWLHLSTPGPGFEPYQVNVTVTGGVVGSLDVYKVHTKSGGGYTPDKITPECPQGYLTDLTPQGDESPGSPSHLNRIEALTLDYHRNVVPTTQAMVASTPLVNLQNATVELPRDQEWVAVIDARLGTNKANAAAGFSRLSFNVSVADGDVEAAPMSPPTLPVDVLNWASNAGQCIP